MSDRLGDLVSVALLTFNCAHRLDRVLNELAALDVPLVAVDNASSDSTLDILRRRGVPVVALDRNIGAAARNVAVDHVATPYVAFCDDDGWYERVGLCKAVELLEAYPALALVNARILVEPNGSLDPISLEMSQSPLDDRAGIPGTVILGFMAGAAVVRAAAFREVAGYDAEFFIGGEEETLAVKLARCGWELRYVSDVVARHAPSLENAPRLRAHGMRNKLWNCWLHRRLGSAVRWTLFVLWDTPKNRDYVRGLVMTARGLPWVIKRRSPMSRGLDAAYRRLDEHHFLERRPLFNTRDTMPAPGR